MSTAPSRLSIVHAALTDAFAGVERYVCQVANGMSRRGHRVSVVGGAPGRMTAELDAEVAHRPAAGVLRGSAALAANRGVDVVHVHMTAAEIAAWLAHPVTSAPIVATRHFAKDRGSSAPARVAARLASRSITVDIAISRFVAEAISGPSRLIYNGVVDQPAAPLDSRAIVMLQRLEQEKDTDLGIRAWAASRSSRDGWRLTVAGTGAQRAALEGLADDLGVAGSVDFVGAVDDTAAFLDGAAVFLAPASVDGFGLSVVEAMAHGVPVVAAAAGGHLETVGDDGMLFPPGDAGAAAAHLDALAGDLAARRRMGARLRERQRSRFSVEQHLDELESLYHDVAARRRRAA